MTFGHEDAASRTFTPRVGRFDSNVFRRDGSSGCAGYTAMTFIDTSIKEPAVLPASFQPARNDVVIGRGKKCYNHIGNRILKQLVTAKLEEYAAITKNRREKSRILSVIVFQVRISGGGFVKIDPSDTTRWFDVGDVAAREKVAQTFRDALHEKYRSSNASKNKKRRLEKKAKKACSVLSHQCHISLDSCNEYSRMMQHCWQTQPPFGKIDDCYYLTRRRYDLPAPPRNKEMIPKVQPSSEAVDTKPKLFFDFPSNHPEDKLSFEPVPFSEAFNMEQNCSIGSKPTSSSFNKMSCEEFDDHLEFIATSVSDDGDDDDFLECCKEIGGKLFSDD